MTKASLTILGALLALTGSVWALQGLNLIGGSFMSGQREWLVIGLVCLVVGIGLMVFGRR